MQKKNIYNPPRLHLIRPIDTNKIRDRHIHSMFVAEMAKECDEKQKAIEVGEVEVEVEDPDPDKESDDGDNTMDDWFSDDYEDPQYLKERARSITRYIFAAGLVYFILYGYNTWKVLRF